MLSELVAQSQQATNILPKSAEADHPCLQDLADSLSELEKADIRPSQGAAAKHKIEYTSKSQVITDQS